MSGTFTLYEGDKGEPGIDGIDGLGVADVSPTDNHILSILKPNNPSESAVLDADRNGQALYTDRYGVVKWAKPRSRTNYIPYSNDLTSWDDPFNRYTILGNTTDPFGGNDAHLVQIDVDTDTLPGSGYVVETEIQNLSKDDIINVSFWVKYISGNIGSMDFSIEANRFTVSTPSSEWVRVTYPTCVPIDEADITFSLNPRGKTGGVVAIYGVQVEKGGSAGDLIITNGEQRTVIADNYQFRNGKNGSLLEGSKKNYSLNSNNLFKWDKTNCTVSLYNEADYFGVQNQLVSVAVSDVEATLVDEVDTLVVGNTYTVSFYALLLSGSVESISTALGQGAASEMSGAVIEDSFTRLTCECVAGASDEIKITINSPPENAQLVICGVQVEVGDISSYVYTCGVSQTRSMDVMSVPYDYNFPSPQLPFTLSFRVHDILTSSTKKYIFSNGLTLTDEFSMYFEGVNLVVNMGGNLTSQAMIQYSNIAVVFTSSSIKFYGQRTLINEIAATAGGSVGDTVFIGYNGTDGSINATISHFIAYSYGLSHNDVLYLQGTE
jgi:hypothetical protein